MGMLDNRVAVVTGAAQGIGKAVALKLADAGAGVAVVDLMFDAAAEVAVELEKKGRKALPVKCNVADPGSVKEMIEKVQAFFPAIDILVNNAGITRDGLLMRMDENNWDQVMAVNLKGPFLTTRGIVPIMMHRRYGRIINVASVVGLMGNSGQANYASSKGGLIALTKSVAREFASRGITCNAVAPGFIETPMTSILQDKVKESYIDSIPLKRFGTADDVANAIAFFASDAAGYITGQVLGIDGGMFMR